MRDYWKDIIPIVGLVVQKKSKITRDYHQYIIINVNNRGIYYTKIVSRRNEDDYGHPKYLRHLNFSWIYRLKSITFLNRFRPVIYETYMNMPKKDIRPEMDMDLLSENLHNALLKSDFLVQLSEKGVEL